MSAINKKLHIHFKQILALIHFPVNLPAAVAQLATDAGFQRMVV
jgi:hypothetical protein